MAKSEDITLPNGKKATEVYKEVKQEVENIYLEGWSKGVSIPFWDKEGNFYLANPDGSEDLVSFDMDWSKGVSIPFWDKEGNFYLANPDGSEDLVSFDMDKMQYTVLSRIAEAGKGRYAYLLNR